MRDLINKIVETQNRIEDIKFRMAELQERAYSPKQSIISDMPKGSAKQNGLEVYTETLDKLMRDRYELNEKLDIYWDVLRDAVKKHFGVDAFEMIRLRFGCNYLWRDCGLALGWTEQKCYRVYRKILSVKIDKKHLKKSCNNSKIVLS